MANIEGPGSQGGGHAVNTSTMSSQGVAYTLIHTQTQGQTFRLQVANRLPSLRCQDSRSIFFLRSFAAFCLATDDTTR